MIEFIQDKNYRVLNLKDGYKRDLGAIVRFDTGEVSRVMPENLKSMVTISIEDEQQILSKMKELQSEVK